MKKLLIAAAVLALAGCHSTWNGVKADSSRIVGRSVSGIGHGIGKAGAALERSGEQIDGGARRRRVRTTPYSSRIESARSPQPPTGTSRPEVLFFRRPLCGMIAA